ncbi:MAG TPA: PAS domain S-box protein [Terriglobales bacterium]|nr:PAS domain S-box protein [Terriglobales bacterium]
MDAARPETEAYEQLLEAVPDAIVVVDTDGRVVRVNRQAETLSGYSREELVGMSVEELVPEALRARHVAHRGAYQRSPAVRSMGSHLDIRFRRRDGSEFPADIALSPVPGRHGVLVVASVRDITERLRAEDELLRAQEVFRLVVEGVHDYAIFMLDPEGRVRTWSPGAARLKGYAAEEIIGRHFSVFYPPEDVEVGKPARELRVAAGTGRYEEDGWRVRRDGTRFWANVVITAIRDQAGRLLGFAKITRDVTERKRQDDRLRAVVEVAQAALEGRPEGELLQLIARRARSMVEAGRAAISLVDAGQDAVTVAAADDVDAAADDEPALVVPLTSGEQPIGRLSVTGEPAGRTFTDEDRELLGLFAAQAAVAIGYSRVRDELQRFAVLEDRERIGRELHDGAIQSLFAVGMGLQGIAMMTSDPAQRDRLEASVGRIDDVIRDLRNYIFGLRPGLAADRHLARALEELAEELEQQHGVACAVDVDPAVAARLAPRAADIVQMTREALSNVGRHAAAATCRLSLRAEGGEAVLEVDDDGQGFVPGAGGGWGLRNLADRAAAMGGSLAIDSVPGEGTAVRLRLPAQGR